MLDFLTLNQSYNGLHEAKFSHYILSSFYLAIA